MNKPKVTRVVRFQHSPVRSRLGFSIISVIVVIALIAIAAGLLLPKIVPKRKIPAAFDEVGVGRTEGNVCTNDYFGLSIRVPEGWQVDSEENLRRTLQRRSADDLKHMAMVLVAAKALKPAPGVVEPMLVIAAKRLSSMPEVKTVEDFMERTQRSLEEMGTQVGEQGKPYKVTLGGQACLRLDGKSRWPTGTVDTTMCSLLRRGYALSIPAAWQTEQDRRALMQSLQTVQFK